MNHVTTTYGEAKVQLHAFLISALMEINSFTSPKALSKYLEVQGGILGSGFCLRIMKKRQICGHVGD